MERESGERILQVVLIVECCGRAHLTTAPWRAEWRAPLLLHSGNCVGELVARCISRFARGERKLPLPPLGHLFCLKRRTPALPRKSPLPCPAAFLAWGIEKVQFEGLRSVMTKKRECIARFAWRGLKSKELSRFLGRKREKLENCFGNP